MDNCIPISVIMSVYNEKEEWLKIAIESILSQTFREFEFIIILDKPDNEILEKIILNFQAIDNRIIFIKNSKNEGLVYSLNKGIEIARGKYIARMDADDISMPYRLELQYNYMEEKGIALLAAQADYIDENGKCIGKGKVYKNRYTIRNALKYKNYLLHPTWLIQANALKSELINGYRKVPFAEDYDLLCRMIANNFIVEQYPKILLQYRFRGNGITNSSYYDQAKITLFISMNYCGLLQGATDEFTEEKMYEVIKKDDFIIKTLKNIRTNKWTKWAFMIFSGPGRKTLINVLISRMIYGA